MLSIFNSMPRRVLRADFLRYLLLAVEGGVYSDADTTLLRPVSEWVPPEYKQRTRLLVGIEAESDVPIAPPGFQVQFCMWTFASAANHPVVWKMVERILELIAEHGEQGYRDEDVLAITGPQGWSEVVYEGLSGAVGREINYTHMQGLKEPVLYGDILVLPIEAFGAAFGTDPTAVDRALVRHTQAHEWRKGKDAIGARVPQR